jgi:hypothetical protein
MHVNDTIEEDDERKTVLREQARMRKLTLTPPEFLYRKLGRTRHPIGVHWSNHRISRTGRIDPTEFVRREPVESSSDNLKERLPLYRGFRRSEV